jgi:hypothetical protein
MYKNDRHDQMVYKLKKRFITHEKLRDTHYDGGTYVASGEYEGKQDISGSRGTEGCHFRCHS